MKQDLGKKVISESDKQSPLCVLGDSAVRKMKGRIYRRDAEVAEKYKESRSEA